MQRLERTATIAEGNGKRSHPDRCRYLDIARGSALECAACLDVLVERSKLPAETASAGKQILLGVVSLLAGLIARFTGLNQEMREEPAPYGAAIGSSMPENEND